MKTCEEMTRNVLERVHAYEAQEPLRRKKRVLKRLIALAAVAVVLCACGIWYAMPVKMVPQLPSLRQWSAAHGDTILSRIISVLPSSRPAETFGMLAPFDLEAAVSGHGGRLHTATLTGTVDRIRCFQVYMKNGLGEETGPFDETLIDVTVTECFDGGYAAGESVTLLYPYRISDAGGWVEDSPDWTLQAGREYLFACGWKPDDAYFAYGDEVNPGNRDRQDPLREKADVILGTAFYYLFPVENDTVFIFRGYFENDPDALAQALPPEQIETVSFHPLDLRSRIVLAYDRATFRQLFNDLLATYRQGG